MTAIPLETTNGSLSTFDAAHLPDTVRGPVNVATEMAHLVTETAGDLIAKEVDLLRIEGDEIAKSAAALGRSGEPTTALQDYLAAMRTSAESALSDRRDIQDLMRGCAWGLFALYLDSISIAAGNGPLIRH